MEGKESSLSMDHDRPNESPPDQLQQALESWAIEVRTGFALVLYTNLDIVASGLR